MYRVILIDDEPLILAGIASMICWEEQDCCIVGKATNGHTAIDMIVELRPDIVITDIRMPVMNGLELIEACKEKDCGSAFILLTNLEDFQLAKQAVHLGATDYLVKLDLQPQILIQALEKAKEYCSRMESHHNKELYTRLLKDSREQLERSYFSRLLLHPLEGRSLADQDIAARYQEVYLLLFQMKPEQILFGQTGDYDFQFVSSQLSDIVSRIAGRYFCSHTMLMPKKDQGLLVLSPKAGSDDQKAFSDLCEKINIALSTYFALTALFGVSRKKTDHSELPRALEEARAALNGCYYDSGSLVVFYQDRKTASQPPEREFNINFLKRSMSAAVMENEGQVLRDIFTDLSELFMEYRPNKTQAASACINIYTYLHDLLQKSGPGDHGFPYSIDIAGQLAQLGSLEDILAWLDSFCEKVCGLLDDRKEKRSDKLVYMAKRYIHEHYREKLALSDIADALNISPGHLSTTFSRYMDQTLSDYIAEVKIEHAKGLLDQGQYLIYEIADQLGFENAYYFSKVFKKVTGMSPKSYKCLGRTDPPARPPSSKP